MKQTLIALLVLSSPCAHAERISSACKELATCARKVAQLTGQKYVFDKSLKGKAEFSETIELTKDNAELYFTQILNMNGFSRVLLGEPNAFVIKSLRDATDLVLPTYSASLNQDPKLPNSWDLATLTYTPKSKDARLIDDLARMLRSFSPPNSRIIPDERAGIILVTDSTQNLKKIYQLLKDSDKEPSNELKESWKKREEDVKCPACSCKTSG